MLRTTVVLWALMACGAACAQVSGRVALVSDYRYRGVSLSDRRPAAQASLYWDGARGGYAGALLSSARIATGGDLHAVSYLGIARRMRAGPSWEAGAQFVLHGNPRGDHYRELYLGLASERLGARLYLRPAAFGPQGHAAYLELNAWHPLGERVQLFAHAGQGWQAEGMTRTYSICASASASRWATTACSSRRSTATHAATPTRSAMRAGPAGWSAFRGTGEASNAARPRRLRARNRGGLRQNCTVSLAGAETLPAESCAVTVIVFVPGSVRYTICRPAPTTTLSSTPLMRMS